MPLISGGIFHDHNTKGALALRNLLDATKERLSTEDICLLNELGIAVVMGKENDESQAEIVRQCGNKLTYIAGRVFNNDGGSVSCDNAAAEAIKNTQGEYLGKQLWGRYIVVQVDKEEKSITLFRDPQGLVTLFYVRYADGYLFSSDISLLYDAVEEKPELNWSYLVTFIVNAHNITTATPFCSIFELEPGCATQLSLQSGVTISQFWDPTTIKSAYIKDEEEFQEKLYHTFKMVTAAWIDKSESVCLELSGGLDSSSVLAVLKGVMPPEKPLSAINIFHPAIASANEVEEAQSVARAYQVPLQLFDWDKGLPFKAQKVRRRISRPSTFILDLDNTQEIVALSGLGTRGEFVSGQGGDHLFLAPPFVDCLADALLEGKLSSVLRKASELSAYHRMPYVRIFSKTLQSLVHYSAGNLGYLQLSLEYEPWMNRSFRERVDLEMYRPFFWEKLKKIYPAKAQHILALYSSSHKE